MTDTDARQFWDDLYGERAQRWSGKVNAPLEQRAADLPPGRALDLGCGEGADALWLAAHGWAVTAVDISATALDRARAEAGRRGLAVDWQRLDLTESLPGGPYDLVSAQFLQSPVAFARTAGRDLRWTTGGRSWRPRTSHPSSSARSRRTVSGDGMSAGSGRCVDQGGGAA